MKDDDLLAVVREWVEKAESDFDAALRLLRSGTGFPTGVVCFLAQQCVEKYLKGHLAGRTIDFPKTHNIGHLLSLLPEDARPEITVEEQRTLTAYATRTRYPGEGTIQVKTARQAMKVARRIRKEVRGLLPPKPLSAGPRYRKRRTSASN